MSYFFTDVCISSRNISCEFANVSLVVTHSWGLCASEEAANFIDHLAISDCILTAFFLNLKYTVLSTITKSVFFILSDLSEAFYRCSVSL